VNNITEEIVQFSHEGRGAFAELLPVCGPQTGQLYGGATPPRLHELWGFGEDMGNHHRDADCQARGRQGLTGVNFP
jgi:hypothetical protein